MSVNKVEMSLDDIIKANKSKGKANKRGAFQKAVGSKKTPKRIVKYGNRVFKNLQQKNTKRAQNKPTNSNFQSKRNVSNKAGRPQKINSIATKKLVQKLVKKALAQRNISRIIRDKPTVKPAIPKRGAAVRYVKQTVVMNRVNPRSRVISRNIRGRGIVRLASNPQFLPSVSRVKYASAVRPIFNKRQQPQITYVRQRQPKQQIVLRQQIRQPAFVQQRPIIVQSSSGFRRNGKGRLGTSVRDRIASLRQEQQVVYVQRPKPQVTYVQRQIQRPQKQHRGNSRFQGQRKPQNQQRRLTQRNNDPFYEPPNYLQRF